MIKNHEGREVKRCEANGISACMEQRDLETEAMVRQAWSFKRRQRGMSVVGSESLTTNPTKIHPLLLNKCVYYNLVL